MLMLLNSDNSYLSILCKIEQLQKEGWKVFLLKVYGPIVRAYFLEVGDSKYKPSQKEDGLDPTVLIF